MNEWLRKMENAGYITAKELRRFSILESRRHPGKTKFRHQIECLEKVGYGVAPDPRYIFWAENYSEPKYFFQLENEILNEWRTQMLKSNILEMALAIMVLNTGGKIAPFEKNYFLRNGSYIYGDDFPERLRYQCHLSWLFDNPPNTETIPGIFREFELFDHGIEPYSSTFVEYTLSNGFVHRDKIKLIERIFKEMNQNLAYYYGQLRTLGGEYTGDTLPSYIKFLTRKKVSFTSKSRSKLTQGVQKRVSTKVTSSDQEYFGRAAFETLVGISKKEKLKALQWIPKGSTVTIAGRKIKGMIYIGKNSKLLEFDQFYCSASIDPSLQVSKQEVKKNTTGFPTYPSYLRLNSRYRATYLNWLTTDRVDKQYNSGFPKLYLYGLEYRFFVENPSLEEKREILEEARRVFEAYKMDDPTYLSIHRFIDIAAVLIGDEELKPIIELGDRRDRKSLTPVMIAISQQVALGQNIPADWCLSWYLNQRDTRLYYSLADYASEFTAHFRFLFEKEFPNGYEMRPAKENLKIVFCSSSDEFAQEFDFTLNGKPLPNVNELDEPVKKFKAIFIQTEKDLRPFQRYIRLDKSNRYSIEAMEKVPEGIRGEIWAPRLSFLNDAIANPVLGEGFLLRELCERMEGSVREKIMLRQYAEISRAMNYIGYGLCPDPRLLARAPKLDDLVLVFPVSKNDRNKSEVSESLLTRIVEMGVGVWIGSPLLGNESSLESTLNKRIELLSNLKAEDSKVLQAHVKWFISTEFDITTFHKWLRATTVEQKEDLRQSALAMVGINGEGSSESISRLEKLYALLGYDTQQVYSDIYTGGAIDGPVTVRRAKVGPKGEIIPDNTKDHKTVSLDTEKIEELVDETEKVKAVLSSVFFENLSSENDNSDEVKNIIRAFSGLDQKHTGLVTEFMSKERWTVKGFEKLATKHDLMWQGCLEVINEWSFDRFEEELIEEFNGYRPNPKTTEKLKDLLQRTVQ